MSIPTEFTVRPAAAREEPIFGVRTPGDTDQISTDDVVRGLNPLHHIPFVSQVYEAVTGEQGSSVGKLIGGAVLGGPIGFLASLASVVFEQENGKSIMTAMVDAVSGEETTTQLASAKATSAYQTAAASDTAVSPVASVEILPPEPKQAAATTTAQEYAQQAQHMKLASAISTMASDEDSAVLSLFGGQAASAHRSYQKAQMLPYLRDVTHSQVL
jgi:hypothetical protein